MSIQPKVQSNLRLHQIMKKLASSLVSAKYSTNQLKAQNYHPHAKS
jgi:hypothetical protein